MSGRLFVLAFLFLCLTVPSFAQDYLKLTANIGGSKVSIVNIGGNNPNLEYSTDDGDTWTSLSEGTEISLPLNGYAIFRGNNPDGFSHDATVYTSFKLTGKVSASGNVMSLVDPSMKATKVPGNYCFESLFRDCEVLATAPDLPAPNITTSCYRNMFNGCTSLVSAPELPATMLTAGCYSSMFEGCTKLTKAPDLPATSTEKNCYEKMFARCTSLENAPRMKAKSLAIYACQYMYQGCTKLKNVPDFEAMDLSSYCCFHAFDGCTSLGKAPALPADTMADFCYNYMFNGCSSLTDAPELPATALASNCYAYMFSNCASLKSSPYLPADKLESMCYDHMFQNCSSLVNVPDFTFTTAGSSSCSSMFSGCGSLVDAPALPAMNLAGSCYSNMFSGCRSLKPAPELPATDLASSCYESMFRGCSSITEIPDLPANVLQTSCYSNMFSGCSKLSKTPVLPARVLADGCYGSMFSDCVSLTQAPELPVKDLKSGCYRRMFGGCTSIAECPELPAEATAPNCYQYMFYGCTGIKNPPVLKSVLLSPYCYAGMFDGCVNLLTAPELPAEILAEGCYSGMFSGCQSITESPVLNSQTLAYSCYSEMLSGTSIKKAPVLPAKKLKGSCYSGMFSGCALLEQAPELPLVDLADGCYASMFQDCVSLKDAPELPATKLADGCYNSIFSGCTALENIICHFSDWQNGAFTSRWVDGVASNGLFICQNDLNGLSDFTHFPTGWTVKKINYLTFTADGKASTISVESFGNSHPDLEYSFDRATWTKIKGGEQVLLNSVNGLTVYFRGTNPEGFSTSEKDYTKFSVSGNVRADGNIMSLIDRMGIVEVVPCDYCFYSMFADCADLETAPPLVSASVLTDNCYRNMFRNCGKIDRIEVNFTDWNEQGHATQNWVENVADEGVFECSDLLPQKLGVSYIPEKWRINAKSMLTFTAREPNSTVGFVTQNGAEPNVEYSTDGGASWTILHSGDSVELKNIGDEAIFRGNNPSQFSSSETSYTNFVMEGLIDARGSIMSLLDQSGGSKTIPSASCFYRLFKDCGALRTPPSLPATRITTSCYKEMFLGCTGLIEAPELPAIEITDYCYQRMFKDCESLAKACELPAKTLTKECYRAMFANCKSLPGFEILPADVLTANCYDSMFVNCAKLTDAPILPALNLEGNCYSNMFNGCESLTKAPELPSHSLVSGCYRRMFANCTSLAEAPELPAIIMAGSAYDEMFANCTNLAHCPELPSLILAGGCYNGMFRNCTSLTEAPDLPAQRLASNCYANMFAGCTGIVVAPEIPDSRESGFANNMFSGCEKLNFIKVGFDKWGTFTNTWVKGVAPEGMFIMPDAMVEYHSQSHIPEGWIVPRYLSFTALDNGGSVELLSENNVTNVEYSMDAIRWMPYSGKVDLVANGTVYFRGHNPEGFSSGPDNYSHFALEGDIRAEGSVMSLIDGLGLQTEIPCDYCFYRLFDDCSQLVSAPKLPALKLSKACYSHMFSGCQNIEKAPILPATKLEPECYSFMFDKCSKINYLETHFYEWNGNATNFWMEFVADGGTFVCPAELPAEISDSRIHEGWRLERISDLTLTANVERSSVTLKHSNGNIPDIQYSTDGGQTWKYMMPDKPITLQKVGDKLTLRGYNPDGFSCVGTSKFEMDGSLAGSGNITSLIDGVGVVNVIEAKKCFASLFDRCDALTTAPVLNAVEVADDAYGNIFSGCSQLRNIKVLFSDWGNPAFTSGWVQSVSPTGVFLCPISLPVEIGGSRIPKGWIVNPHDIDTSMSPLTIVIERVSSIEYNTPVSFQVITPKGFVLRPVGAVTMTDLLPVDVVFDGVDYNFVMPNDDVKLIVEYDPIMYKVSGDEHVINLPVSEANAQTPPIEFQLADLSAQNLYPNKVLVNDTPIPFTDFDSRFSMADFLCDVYISVVYGDKPLPQDPIDPDPVDPVKPDDPNDPTNPDDPKDPEKPDDPANPSQIIRFDISVDNLCPGSDLEIVLNVISGNPVEYDLVFEDANLPTQRAVPLPAISADGKISISVPLATDIKPGKYKGKICLADAEYNASDNKGFEFEVYYPADVIEHMFADVVYVNNGSDDFVGYQWIKDNKEIEDANYQFYSDLPYLKGYYATWLTLWDGRRYRTCNVWIDNSTYQKSARREVRCYPSPAVMGEPVSLEFVGFDEQECAEFTVYIYNQRGMLATTINNPMKMNRINLPEGDYVGVAVSDGCKLTFKLIIKR